MEDGKMGGLWAPGDTLRLTGEKIKTPADWLRGEARRCAVAAWQRCVFHAGPFACVLVFKSGELRLIGKEEETPEGFELAGGKPLTVGSLTMDQITSQVHERARRLACLPSDV